MTTSHEDDGVRGHKARVRHAARTARRALAASDRAAAARAVAQRALDLPEIARARSVLAYSAMDEELDPAPLVRAVRERGARVALPRVCGPGVLSLHWVGPDEPLVPGHAGIGEPAQSCAWASPSDLDLVLVPGVAFDASCRRLGFGGGYYDAMLMTLPPDAVVAGLAFDEQVHDEVPTEEHDVPLDLVITPTRVLRRED